MTLDDIPIPGFERVVAFRNDPARLSGVIAIHSLARGPGSGGCRLWQYATPTLGLEDALRLAKGMSFKNALADLPLGGAKAIVQFSPDADRELLFSAFGDVVERLGGAYVTAEDVGTTVSDMQIVAGRTRHVSGIAGGDPSPWTALGVYLAMREAVLLQMGRASLSGLTIAVQGVGNVGRALCRLIRRDGGNLVIADVNATNLRLAQHEFDASVERPEDIHATDCHVFAPCALGAALNPKTIPQIQASIICGAANNQLATRADADQLQARGIFYAPDYLVNAGGIINVAAEYLDWSKSEVSARLDQIPHRLAAVHGSSLQNGQTMSAVADDLAASLLIPAPQSALEPAPSA